MKQGTLNRKRIALIGAGQIGGTMAHILMMKTLCDIVLLDITDGFAKGKAMDLNQASAIGGYNSSIIGTNDYADIVGSDVVIITAGKPRTSDMSREDVLKINANIIKTVAEGVARYAPDAFVIVITNPLDAIVHLFHKYSGIKQQMIVGMAGVLDGARFRYFLSSMLNVAAQDIHTLLIGSHSDAMVPLPRYTTISGISLDEFVKSGKITQEQILTAQQKTKTGGVDIIKLLGRGSAYYAPAIGAISIAESYLLDKKCLLSCASYLNGEYGINDMYLGVPVIIGKNGVEKTVILQLSEEEMRLFNTSADTVRKINSLL